MTVFTIIIILVLLGAASYLVLEGRSNSELSEDDARRFAKLLISEIKLYETYKVERGLKNNNLYESLRDEIEEARKKYKKRFSDSEFEIYFDEALVKILADGNQSKLSLISTSLN